MVAVDFSGNGRHRLRSRGLLLLLLAGLALSVQAAGPGAKLYQEMREKDQLYPDEAWQEYVTAIGERMLAASPHAGRNYTFAVVDSSEVNAFATPDAYIFLHRGVIAYLRSEQQLAGIIGHEIGHVVGRHAKRRFRNQVLGNILGWMAAIGTGTGAMMDLGNTLTATLQSGYGRQFELEADDFGAEFLARAGYNPQAMIEGIQVLKDHELYMKQVKGQPRSYHGLFASHPKNDKRLHELVSANLEKMPERLVEPVADFWELMDGLVFGDEAATGLIKDGVYYHSGLRIVVAFPDGWDVANNPTEVMGRSPGGQPAAYVSVQRQAPPEKKQTPEEYVKETLKREDLKDGETTEINGFPVYIAQVELVEGASTAQARWLAVIDKGDSLYLFKGELGADGAPADFEAQFRKTLASFRHMTADDLKVANAQRIEVVVAEPGDTYKKLAQSSSLKADAEAMLRVINGDHPYGEPRAGDYVKVVR